MTRLKTNPKLRSYSLAVLLATQIALLQPRKQSGRMEDEAAISSHREELALHPVGHPDRSKSLASDLSIRFDRSGRVEDLEEAISILREALTLRPLGHPDRLNNLANDLVTRFQQSRQDGGPRSCDLIPPRSSATFPVICLLALTIRAGWSNWKMKSQSAAKYSLSILLATQIVPSPSTTSVLFCLLAFNSQAGWRIWKRQTPLHHEALTLRPIGHPDRSQSLDNLANTLSTLRTWKGQARSSMKHSLSVLLVTQSAPHVSTTSPMFCLLAFTDWAEWRT